MRPLQGNAPKGLDKSAPQLNLRPYPSPCGRVDPAVRSRSSSATAQSAKLSSDWAQRSRAPAAKRRFPPCQGLMPRWEATLHVSLQTTRCVWHLCLSSFSSCHCRSQGFPQCSEKLIGKAALPSSRQLHLPELCSSVCI